MRELTPDRVRGKLIRAITLISITFTLFMVITLLSSRPTRAEAPETEPAPQADQEYTGVKRCASCHFEEYMKWKKSEHSEAFELLTEEYETDEECLKCHTTGFGEPSGFKNMEDTPALAGVTCETCHGPGSYHEEVSKPFAQVKELTAEQEKKLRDSIWKMLPKNVCVECHMVQAHKESQTPPELREE
ncbi:MAG: cytochrome c family protein [Planctomycetota bacterium]